MKLTYAITANDEVNELGRLLEVVTQSARDTDEILVQLDCTYTKEIKELCDFYFPRIRIISFPLNGNFAEFKNNICNHATGDYIFQLDADELVDSEFIEALPQLITANCKSDVFAITRINTVDGITSDDIHYWNWTVNEHGYINYPDYQARIWKNVPNIRFKNKIHEALVGYKFISTLPQQYYILHEKTIEKQRKQNSLYEQLI